MRGIDARLERLERTARQGPPAEGCDTCREWPEVRFAYADDWHESGTARDPFPAACPSCGRTRQEVRFAYAADWRSGQ